MIKKRMKKIFIALAFVFVACIDMSCSEDRFLIWDVSGVSYYITMEDTDGHDLLDPASEDNLLNTINVIYDGKTYTPEVPEYFQNNAPATLTRAYFPVFRGLRLEWDYLKSEYYLVFGEFSGESKSTYNEILLTIAPGVTKKMSFFNNCEWHAGEPHITRHFYYEDKEIEDGNDAQGHFRFRLNPKNLSDNNIELIP